MKERINEDNNLDSLLQIKEYKTKYRIAAEQIYVALGVNNYSNPYNCMTRFRAIISDKKLVDLEKIKKIQLVKGINWNGQELQIIIGGEVVKVVDEFKKYEEYLTKPQVNATDSKQIIIQKPNIGKRIMMAIAGIVGPSIGILMASGIMGAIYALLTLPNGANVLQTSVQTGVNDDGKPIMVAIEMNNLNLFDTWSSIFFVLKSVILNSIGLFFIYNTTKYFKGNTIFAIAIGITMMSRGFFPMGVGTPFDDAQFGDWTSNMGKSGFLLFKLGDYPIVIGGYEGAVIPYIVAGITLSYLDRWIKTWMPSVVDIIFRPTLVYFMTLLGVWFLLGPTASLIEYGLITMMQEFGNTPYGFGTALFALLWQPIVLTGCHVAVVLPLITDVAQGNPQLLLGAMSLGVWGQVGAAIGVIIVTRNMNLKTVAIGGITGGLFGVTEPIIYGVTLLKVRPFLLGCIGGFIGGFVQGNLGIAVVRQGGLGIFGILGYEISDIPWALMIWAISIVSAMLLTALLYQERKNEYSYFKVAVHKLIKSNKDKKDEIVKEFKNETDNIKNKKTIYKKVDKYYSTISEYENKLLKINEKESKQRSKMYRELSKMKNKLSRKENSVLFDKFNTLNTKYESFNLDKEKLTIQTKLTDTIINNELLIKEFMLWKETVYNQAVSKANKYTENLAIPNIMWNALNNIEIGYGIEDAKLTKFKKKGGN